MNRRFSVYIHFSIFICAILPALFLILSCGPQSRIITDKEWLKEKPTKIYTIGNYDSYPILAEKAECVLINKDGIKMWTRIDPAKVPPLAKTNEHGFCENGATVTNAINVYELPDTSSKVIDRIGKGMLVQVLESASYFVKISTPKVETTGWVYKKDLENYTDWGKRNKPKVTIREDANAVYIGEKKILKGISKTHLERNFVQNIANKAVVVTAKNIDDYRGTFENYAPYQQVLQDVAKGGQIRFYERGKILEKYQDGGGCIIKKEFAAFKADKTDASYFAYDIGGEAPMTIKKWEFYNTYGEKTGDWFGDAGEGKYKQYRFSIDGSYVLLDGAMAHAGENGIFGGVSKGFLDKYGRVVKYLGIHCSIGNIYYSYGNEIGKGGVEVFGYVITSPDPVMHLMITKRPTEYTFGPIEEYTTNNLAFYEIYSLDNGETISKSYSVTGKLIETMLFPKKSEKK